MLYNKCTINRLKHKNIPWHFSVGFGLRMKLIPHAPVEKTKKFNLLNSEEIIQFLELSLLYILTSQQVLHTLFAGWNNLFQHFYIFFHHKQKKEKKTWKKGSTSVKVLLLNIVRHPRACQLRGKKFIYFFVVGYSPEAESTDRWPSCRVT